MKKWGIKYENGEIRHRTILKVLFNPVLRKLGCSIVSHINDEGEFIKYEIRSYPKNCKVIR